MILVNTDFISGKEIETIQLVRGVEMEYYPADATQLAEQKLIDGAKSLGADAVVNVQYAIQEFKKVCVVIVSGTAVKFI